MTDDYRRCNLTKFMCMFLCMLTTMPAISDNQPASLLRHSCTQGSLTQIQNHFLDNNNLIFARGQSLSEHGEQRVLFLVSYPINTFQIVSLIALGHSHYEACIESTSIEVDYRDENAPVRKLFKRTYRAHEIFNDAIPNQECGAEPNLCQFWPSQINHTHTTILSAYQLNNNDSTDSYDEIIKLKIGRHVISPSRGRLTQLARTKYALRMNNKLDESASDIEAGKEIYRKIHQSFDHKLALIVFSYTQEYDWNVKRIDRDTGQISTLIEGKSLEMYPLSRNTYLSFMPN